MSIDMGLLPIHHHYQHDGTSMTAPTKEEAEAALEKLKIGKRGGKSGISPEMILYGEAEL